MDISVLATPVIVEMTAKQPASGSDSMVLVLLIEAAGGSTRPRMQRPLPDIVHCAFVLGRRVDRRFDAVRGFEICRIEPMESERALWPRPKVSNWFVSKGPEMPPKSYLCRVSRIKDKFRAHL